ncbi:hypothetical protein GH741_00455 [Aquibacillus halophilus]|uniref:Uncharacterized protein n=1 Tax=Aquibacillus halophilus TaxID=930132 RepID=A0A6A8D600_9BACI|nr:VanZ family protein [Aquibacillus halophilus]MRH41143.1 hypothetical protein [Aquibacillus halophilus]
MAKLLGERVMEMLLDYQIIFGLDKQIHFLSYGVISIILGFLIILISGEQHINRRIKSMWIALVTVGIVEEYRQYMVPNRSAEFLDAVANMFGITLGLAIPLTLWVMLKNQLPIKQFVLPSIILVPLLVGLLYFNERPFLTIVEPLQDNLRNLVAYVGL